VIDPVRDGTCGVLELRRFLGAGEAPGNRVWVTGPLGGGERGPSPKPRLGVGEARAARYGRVDVAAAGGVGDGVVQLMRRSWRVAGTWRRRVGRLARALAGL
jgi:hypothetical protein